MLKVLFFAQTRELVGVEQLELSATEFTTAEQIRQHLATKGEKWAFALEKGK